VWQIPGCSKFKLLPQIGFTPSQHIALNDEQEIFPAFWLLSYPLTDSMIIVVSAHLLPAVSGDWLSAVFDIR
jgi:hypothetical protein